jgi:hypothetical protein
LVSAVPPDDGFAAVLLVVGADLTRVSVLTPVPAAGAADWLAVVPEPPDGATFWLADVFWFVVPAAFTFVLVLDGADALGVPDDCPLGAAPDCPLGDALDCPLDGALA